MYVFMNERELESASQLFCIGAIEKGISVLPAALSEGVGRGLFRCLMVKLVNTQAWGLPPPLSPSALPSHYALSAY